MTSQHRNPTKAKVGTRAWSIAIISLTMFLFGEICALVRKAVECFKCCLMGHPNRSMENSGAGCDLMNCLRLAQEVTEKNFSMLPRYHSCNILVKKVAAFCP